MPNPVLSVFFDLHKNVGGRYKHPHFKDLETEALELR